MNWLMFIIVVNGSDEGLCCFQQPLFYQAERQSSFSDARVVAIVARHVPISPDKIGVATIDAALAPLREEAYKYPVDPGFNGVRVPRIVWCMHQLDGVTFTDVDQEPWVASSIPATHDYKFDVLGIIVSDRPAIVLSLVHLFRRTGCRQPALWLLPQVLHPQPTLHRRP